MKCEKCGSEIIGKVYFLDDLKVCYACYDEAVYGDDKAEVENA